MTREEADATLRLFEGAGTSTEKQRAHLHSFLAGDDGRDFVMVNLLHLKKPVRESATKLAVYQKAFPGALLCKAGHPVMRARGQRQCRECRL
jgi:hypothetical protein